LSILHADPASLFMWGAARVRIAFSGVTLEASAGLALYIDVRRHPSLEVSM
jgi:hypothetical protein